MQSFSDYINEKYNLNEGENASFKNMHAKTTPEEQEKIDIAKGREVKPKEPVVQENPVVSNLKKKIDILYKNYGEMGLKLVDESIIKSHEKLKKLLSNMDSTDDEPMTKVQKPVQKIVKKKETPVVKKKVIVVKEEDDDEIEEVISDNEDSNTATNTVANNLPNVFPNDNQPQDEEEVEEVEEVEEEDEEQEEEKVEEPKKKKKKSEKNEAKKPSKMTEDEIADMLYEKSVEYTNEHYVPEEFDTIDDIPDFMGDDNLNENTISNPQPQIQVPRMDMDNITGDAMDDFADQFC